MKRLVSSIVLTIMLIGFFITGIIAIDSNLFASATFLMSILLVVVISIIVYSLLSREKDKKVKWLENRLNVWNNISYHVKRAGDEAFNELPVGIILYDEKYDISWSNRYAKDMFQNKLIERPISAVHNDLYNQIREEKENIKISVYDKKYEVIIRKEYSLIYFFDVTSTEEIKNKYTDRTPAIGIIYLDNMEEALRNLEVQAKSELRGRYLGEISDWISSIGGYLKSYSDDRLIMILDYNQLRKMIKTHFDILNSIRNISDENQIHVTASIGIACWDVTFDELGSYAQNAVELAEKRGGDQVVVNIENEKIQYFGAKTNPIEKSSKVLVRVMAQTLRDLIEKADNVYIISHFNMDMDAFGAMIGLYKMCLASEKQTKMIIESEKCDKTVRKVLEVIKVEHTALSKHIYTSKQAMNHMNERSLLIIADTQSPQMVLAPEILTKTKKIALIDHHRRGEISYENLEFNYVEPYASSSVELIAEMFPFYGKKIAVSAYEATLMLSGIVIDTNNFTFRTGTRTFDVASLLREYGADMVKVRTILREELSRHQAIAALETKLELLYDKYGIVKIEENVIHDRVFLSQVSEKLLEIDPVMASFTIGHIEEDIIGISARSYQSINVQTIMEELGGGGHLNGAAAQIKNSTVEKVYEMLLSIIDKKQLEEGEEKMKVILLEDIRGRGIKDDIIDVATGYGNFLLSAKKVSLATADNMRILKEDKDRVQEEIKHQLQLMNKIKSEIDNKRVNVYIKMGEEGKAFGTITTKYISEEFEKQFGVKMDKKKIILSSDINSLGIYEVDVHLHKDVIARIEINVLEK